MKKHFTTTVYIISKVSKEVKVLLHMHKKHHFWLGMGGHVEDNENPIQAVLREAEEEAGVKVELFFNKKEYLESKHGKELPLPFTIFEPYVPPFKRKRGHYHIDLVYFGTIKNPKKVRMEENAEHKWFNAKELIGINAPEEVIYYCKEALKMGTKILK